MEDTDWDEAVRIRAYHIWESSGYPDGQNEAHWQQALEELELLSSDGNQAEAQSVAMAEKPTSEDAGGSL